MSAKLPVVLDARAEVDLDAAAQWYAKERVELAFEFFEAIDIAIGYIAQFPQSGREVTTGIRRVLTKKFPFCLYYTIEDGQVIIIAILHFRRGSDTWQQRLKS